MVQNLIVKETIAYQTVKTLKKYDEKLINEVNTEQKVQKWERLLGKYQSSGETYHALSVVICY